MLGGWRGSGFAGQGGFANFFDDRGVLADPPWPCLFIMQFTDLI